MTHGTERRPRRRRDIRQAASAVAGGGPAPSAAAGGPARPRPRRDTVLVVDFGTSLTTATLLSGGVATPVGDAVAGARSWPSSVHLGPDGIVVGDLAEGRRHSAPLAFVEEFKRHLGSAAPVPSGDLTATAAELLTALLTAVWAEAQAKVSEPVDRLLITCPGDYKIGVAADRRWADLDAACRAAGFLDVEYLPEPVAAAYAPVAEGPLPEGSLVLVYDLGGGTFDTALVRIGRDRHEVLAATSIPYCGGADVDALLMTELRDVTGIGPDNGNGRVDALLKTTARDVKQRLSVVEYYDVSLLPTLDGTRITRGRLEELITRWGRIAETVAVAVELVTDTGLALTDVDAIVAVGGSSRIPMVERALRDLGRPVRRPVDIGCAVADGAVAWARRGAERVIDPEQVLPTQVPLRWPLPEGRVTISSWLAEPGDRLGAGDPVVRVAVPGGALWDLRVDRPGYLAAQHYDRGAAVTARDWLGTLRTLHPGEEGAVIAPVRWRRIAVNGGLVAVSPDGARLARVVAHTVHVYDLERWAFVASMQFESNVQQITFHPDGRLFAAVVKNVHVWDPEGQDPPELVHEAQHPRVAVRPDGQVIAVSTQHSLQVAFLQTDTWTEIHTTTGPGYTGGSCRATVFSPDGRILIPASMSSTTARQASDIEGVPDLLWHHHADVLAFHASGDYVYAVRHNERNVLVFDTKSEQFVGSFTTHNFLTITAFAYDSENSIIALALDDGSLVLYRADGGSIVTEPFAVHTIGTGCFFLHFVAGGTMLVAGNAASVTIWNLTDGFPPLAGPNT